MSEPEQRLSLRIGLPLPNPLATRGGRLTAFFLLYVTEGIPLGFTATAVATQMRRQGLGPAQIGVFVGSLYLPWALKFLVGPVVDVVYSQRLGRRRAWIVAMQTLMAVALLIRVVVSIVSMQQRKPQPEKDKAATTPPPDLEGHIAAISAAVYAMIGAHRHHRLPSGFQAGRL